MPLTSNQIYLFLFEWLRAETGLVVINANQKSPRPNRPYVSLRFLNPSVRLGMAIDQQHIVKTGVSPDFVYKVSTEGMRKAVASINIFGDNAIDTLAKVRDSLDRPDVIESFEKAGIVHLDESQISDLTELEETAYLQRGQMDLTVAFTASSEVDVGTIEHVEIDGSVDGVDIPIHVNIN